MKKNCLIKYLFLISILFVSLFSYGCSNNTYSILVNNLTENYGTYSLSKESGKIGDEVTLTYIPFEGYTLEYALFNSEKLEISDDLTSIFVIEEKNEVTISYTKILDDNEGVLSFTSLSGEEGDSFSLSENNIVLNNFTLNSIDSSNLFYTGNHSEIAFGYNNGESYIKLNFLSKVVIEKITIRGKYYSKSNTNPKLIIYDSNGSSKGNITYTSKAFANKSITFEEDFLTDSLLIKAKNGNQLVIEKVTIYFGDLSNYYPKSLEKKYSSSLKVNVNSTIDLSNFYYFYPLNAINTEVSLYCDNENIKIEGTNVTTLKEGEYQVKVVSNFDSNLSISIDISCSDSYTEGISKIEDEEITLTNYEVKLGRGLTSTPSIGDVNIIIVPIQFSDINQEWTKERLNLLNTVTNGNANSYWESLSSYYYKSSYGKLNLNCVISDVYVPSFTSSYFISKQSSSGDETKLLIKEMYSKLTINSELVKDNVSKYDSNNDNYIDGIWLVYNEFSYSKISSNRFWAYTYWYNSFNQVFNDEIHIGTYANMGAGFIYRKSSLGYDAHTFIHETGHMLGLDDFYTYDSNAYFSSLGGTDMMDFNIGDHCSFSKFSNKWVNPYVIDKNYSKKEFSVTLNSFTETGDCLILPSSSFNNTAFGEYVILEYYTSTYLNELDSKSAYAETYLYNSQLFTINGLKAIHVDARLYKIGNEIGYYDKNDTNITYPSSINDDYTIIAASNSKKYQYGDMKFMLTLLNPSSTNLYNNRMANDSDLFTSGDKISKENISNSIVNGAFNDGSSFDYEVSIVSLTDDKIELTITC